MKNTTFIFICLALLTVFSACRKRSYETDPSASIQVPTDSVLFDTVFTRIGSTTKYFKIFNPYNKRLVVSNIALAGGNNSSFRLNINGKPGNSASDIEIPPNDSLYVFVEVTVDPTSDVNPFLIKDSVLFTTNGNSRKVMLTAFGRNAHYIKGSWMKHQDYVWTDSLPYLIYDYVAIDSGASLTIMEGTEVYFHGNTSLHIFDATLDVRGTAEAPVTFQNSRLESYYDDQAGQWGGIWLWRDCKGATIDHAEISNSVYGIRVDSLVEDTSVFKLQLTNSVIRNTTASGLIGYTASVYCANTLFYNCGINALRMVYGGYYRFNYVTVEGSENHTKPLVLIANHYVYQNQIFAAPFIDVEMKNSIISGTLEDEFEFAIVDLEAYGGYSNINIQRSMVVSKDETSDYFNDCLFNEDPLFTDIQGELYDLQVASPAVDYGLNDPETDLISIDFDIEGTARPKGTAHDIGCYESH